MHKYGKLYPGATPPTDRGGSVGSYNSRGKNNPTPLMVHTILYPKEPEPTTKIGPTATFFGRILEEGEPGT